MNGSILTNQGAMVALQTMKSINKDLSGVQDMISTGKKVATSKDNAAIWAIASIMESDVSSFKSVSDSLALGESTVAVARNASEQVNDALQEIKSKIIAAQEENVDRDKIQADVDAIRNQIKSIVSASQFNGLNLLKTSEDLQVLSSLDRASNGAVTTSTIAVDAKSLDSGTAADSKAGTSIIDAVNTGGPVVTAALTLDLAASGTVTDGVATTTTFTNGTDTFAFTTTQALDEGDAITLTIGDGTDTAQIVYTQTATGTAQTTAEELADQLVNAWNAFATRDGDNAKVDVDADADGFGAGNTAVGDYDSSTGTYYAQEGTFVITSSAGNADNLINSFALSESAGVLTVDNQRDVVLTLTATAEADQAQTDLNVAQQDQGVVSGTISLDYTTADVNGAGGANNGAGIQSDDTLLVTIGEDLNDTGNGAIEASDAFFSISITGAALDNAQLAETVELATSAYIAGDIASDAAYTGSNGAITANGNGSAIINGATVTFTYNANGGSLAENTFQTNLDDDLTVTNGGSGIATFTGANNVHYAIQSDLTIGSTATLANIAITGGVGNTDIVGGTDTVAAGTIGDFAKIDINAASTQAGDTLSITIEGANSGSPITYTAGNGDSQAQIATGFAAAINTQLAADGLDDFFEATANGTTVELKNFSETVTRNASTLSVVNELTNAATASAATIAAAGTQTVTFAANTLTEGDTYGITVGSTTVNYTARSGDTLNDVGRNLEGLLKINTSDNLTVEFTSVTDPTTENSTLSITNNGTSSITTFTATAFSGGTVGGGLELLDDINVTTAAKAAGSLDLIEGLIEVAVDAASSYGSSEKRLEDQQSFISQLTDSLQTGIGSLVDANLEEASARLQALQVQQQLGTQALSIANQAPQNILALFR